MYVAPHEPGHGRKRGQDPLFPVDDYHPLIIDRTGGMVTLEADHRRHASSVD